jgi:hypothetical protein
MRFVVALTYVACGGTASEPDASTDAASDTTVSDTPTETGTNVVTALQGVGFSVQPGGFGFFDTSQCCTAPTCFGNNPSSPYASVSLAGADGGLTANWQLRQDEVIVVVIAQTPPPGRYFGYTPYIFDQATDAGRQIVFASIGDTTNDLVIKTPQSPVFSAPTVLLVGANTAAVTNAAGAVVAAGHSMAEVNVVPIPGTPDVAVGLDPTDATFTLLQRMALLDDPDAGAAYQANPPVQVLRATPVSELTPNPFPSPTFRTPGTGTNETALQTSVTALHDAIVAKYSTETQVPLNVSVRTPDQNDQYGYYCIDNDVDCAGDNRDAVYGVSDLFFFGATDFVVVYGVNHTMAAKTTYANASVYDAAKLLGVAAVDDRSFAGTANVYIPSDPNAASLYAWMFARDCGMNPYCTVIPTTCPGVTVDGLAFVATRAYLEPATKTRPLATELVLDGAIHFKP